MTNNVLFVSYDGLTDPLGFSQIIPYLEIISKNKINLTVISFEKDERFHRYKNQIYKNFIGKKIVWTPLKFSNSLKKISKVYDFIRLFISILKYIFNNNNIIIHVRGHPPAFTVFFLKLIFNNKLIFDFRGLWVDERLDNSFLNKKKQFDNLLYIFFKFLEKKILKKSDEIVVLTHKAKKEIVSLFNLDIDKISVIPCCTDYNIFNIYNKKKINIIKKRLKINDKKIIITYLGSLGGVYLLDEMLHFYSIVNKKENNSLFQILTNDINIAKNLIDKKYLFLKNNIIVKSITRHQLNFFLCFSDYTISFISPSYARIASSPTKISESLAFGIPIISNSGYGDIEYIINKFNCGYLIKNFKDDELINIVDKMINYSNFNKENIIYTTKKNYHIKNAAEKYNNIYKKLININE